MQSPAKLKRDLAFLSANFSFLLEEIKKMQTRGLALSGCLDVYENVRARLSALKDRSYLEKFDKILDRNVGYRTLLDIRDVLEGKDTQSENQYVSNLSPAQIAAFKFCPVTSCDVERVFSKYKNTLSDRRRSFLFDNLKKYVVANCNSTEFARAEGDGDEIQTDLDEDE